MNDVVMERAPCSTSIEPRYMSRVTSAVFFNFMPTLERSLSRSPRRTPNDDGDMDVDKNTSPPHKPLNNVKSDMKVVIVTNLTRNVVESHLQTIFGFYGQIAKVDLPLFGKCKLNLSKLVVWPSDKCVSWTKSRKGRPGIRRR